MKCINPLNKGSIFRPPQKINNQKVFFSTTQFIVRMMDFSCDAVTVAGDDQSRKKKVKFILLVKETLRFGTLKAGTPK